MSGWVVSLAAAFLATPLGAGSSPSLVTFPRASQVDAPERCVPDTAAGSVPRVRLFFVTDVHSGHGAFERVLEDASRERPHLVVDGGDFVHDGTWSEFRRANADRERIERPWHVAKGNHDALRVGPFPTEPPRLPAFEAFDCRDVRFIVLDNHDARLTEEQFRRLEAELEEHQGQRMVVVMHVPATLSRQPFMTRLRHLVPFGLASPTMSDDAQVARFTDLMARHQVLAVLAGHTHFHDEQTIGGVRYIVAGTAGGLTPGLGIPAEYLDIEIDGWDMRVRRVRLRDPAGDPVTFVARAFRFFAGLNAFNHAEQGWNYPPSVSVQLRGGARLTEARGGQNAAVAGAVSFERVFGSAGARAAFVDVGLSAATRELAAELAVGYKLRPVGDFNRNAFVAAGGSTNAGVLRGHGTAGVGARIELGVEWEAITVGLHRDWATNHRSTALVLGRRF